MKITATIITLNEERNIARAIESLRCCDEILILDSGSTDRTVELAQNLGARVIEAGWRGYAAQKNWAAEQAAHDWILSLDADEALSEALEAEIWSLKKAGPRCDAYTMPRLARYLGRWILHSGWYPDRKVRLYRPGKSQVGGRLRPRKRAGFGPRRTPGKQYPALHLRLAFRAPEDPGPLHHARRAGTGGAQKRVPLFRLILDPAVDFPRSYLLQRGFLDGLEGLIIAYMAAFYTFLKYSKARIMS